MFQLSKTLFGPFVTGFFVTDMLLVTDNFFSVSKLAFSSFALVSSPSCLFQTSPLFSG